MGDIAEVESVKNKVTLDIPIHIGFMVLERAKLILLQFYYDFLLKYLPLDGFCLVQA